MSTLTPLDTSPLGASAAFAGTLQQDAIVYNGYSLQSTSVLTTLCQHDSMPNRDTDIQSVPRSDGEALLGAFWRRKKISLAGVVRSSTAMGLESELAVIKRALSRTEGWLDIKVNDTEIRRYRATLMNPDGLFKDRKGYHVTTCPYIAEFAVLDAFGHALDYVSQAVFSYSGLSLTDIVTNTGTAPARPVCSLVMESASGITRVTLSNATTGEAIVIPISLAAGDYLRIDPESLLVTKNGAAVDYSGVFPHLALDANALTLTLDGASAVYTLTTKYLPSYL